MLGNILSVAVQRDLYSKIFSDRESPVKGLIEEIKNHPGYDYSGIVDKRISQETKADSFFSLCLEILVGYYKNKGKKANLDIGDINMYFLLYKKFDEIKNIIDSSSQIKDKQLVKDLVYFVGKSVEMIFTDKIDEFNTYIQQYEQSLKPIRNYTDKEKYHVKKNQEYNILLIAALMIVIGAGLIIIFWDQIKKLWEN